MASIDVTIWRQWFRVHKSPCTTHMMTGAVSKPLAQNKERPSCNSDIFNKPTYHATLYISDSDDWLDNLMHNLERYVLHSIYSESVTQTNCLTNVVWWRLVIDLIHKQTLPKATIILCCPKKKIIQNQYQMGAFLPIALTDLQNKQIPASIAMGE